MHKPCGHITLILIMGGIDSTEMSILVLMVVFGCCLQVSLHNNALINMDTDPTGGFKKLNFLLQSPPFPPETFNNLLLL